jgi:hypothetical protein
MISEKFTYYSLGSYCERGCAKQCFGKWPGMITQHADPFSISVHVLLHWTDTVTAISDKLLLVARHSSVRSNVLSVPEFFKLPNYRHLINAVFKYRI